MNLYKLSQDNNSGYDTRIALTVILDNTMNSYSHQSVKDYQDACMEILERGHLALNDKGEPDLGICWAAEVLTAKRSYSITYALSNPEAYENGFGYRGVINDTRLFFMLFVTTLSTKDLTEMVNT